MYYLISIIIIYYGAVQSPVSVQYLVLGTLALYFSQYFQLNIYSLFSHLFCTSLYNTAGGLPSQSVDVLLSDSSTLHLTSENRRMAWHKGSWWPLFVKEWYAPKSSQHMFDPYSFCLIVLGLIFHLLWGTDDIDYWIFGFLAALLLELVLEIVGNSQFILKRIRKNSGTSGEYIGKTGQRGIILKIKKKTCQVTPFRISLETFSPLDLATSWALSSWQWSSGGSASSGLPSRR